MAHSSKISQSSVLVAESSPIVIANIKILLREIGFSDRLIHIAKDVRSIVSLAKKTRIDTIICDYHFDERRNGKQIIEELRENNFIQKSCSIVMLTADTSGGVVKSILDLDPDEYLVKPYSLFELKRRVARTYKRKQEMSHLYQLSKNATVKEIQQAFDSALDLMPDYAGHIHRLKGYTLVKRGDYAAAARHYHQCLRKQPRHWAICGLAESLIALNELDQAESMIQSWLSSGKTKTPKIYELLAMISARKGDLTSVHEQLTQAVDLTKGAHETLLARAVVNEMLLMPEKAIKDYQSYMHQSVTTFKDGLLLSITMLRLKLMVVESNRKANLEKIRNEALSLAKTEFREEERLALMLVQLHIDVLEEDHKGIRHKLTQLIKSYQTLGSAYSGYLLYLLHLTHNYQLFDKLYKRYEKGVKKHHDLLSICTHRWIEQLNDRRKERYASLKRVEKYILREKNTNQSSTIGIALELSRSRQLCQRSASTFINLADEIGCADASLAELRNVITSGEKVMVYGMELTALERKEALHSLKRIKVMFNQRVAACA